MNIRDLTKELQRREQQLKVESHKLRIQSCPTIAMMAEAGIVHLAGYRIWLERYLKTAGDGRKKPQPQRKVAG